MADTVTPATEPKPKSPTPSQKATTPDGLRRNSDPALQESHQHRHEHLHHSPRVDAHDHHDPVYTKGTTFGSTLVPEQDKLHKHEGEKNGLPEYSDQEKNGVITRDEEEGERPSGAKAYYRRFRPFVHLFIFLLFTGWWITGLVLYRNTKNWVIPFLFWLCIVLRLLFFYVPISIISKPIKMVWEHTGVVVYNHIPEKFRTIAGAAVTIAAILVGAFASDESADNTRENRAVSLFGLAVFIGVMYITSANRKAVNWRPVISGMLAQYIIALFVLRTSVGFDIFSFISARASDLLGFAGEGTAFLTAPSVLDLHWFLTGVIPPIIFFVSIVQVLYYIGFLQWFIMKFATFVFWALRVSGAEAVVAAATPFIGQGESAMLVRPFVPHMTKAEIHQIMCCGFATISGSVLVAYIGLGLNPQAMVSSCIMSIPASLAISKLRYPETEETLTAGRVVIPDDDEHKAENALHAFANGAWLGIKIAGTIVASLLCILAFVGLVNGLLKWWGSYLSIEDPQLTLELIGSYLFYPIAFLLGVPRNGDILKVSKLIAMKVISVSLPTLFRSARAPPRYVSKFPHVAVVF
jgi:concentrative nucleoside transporter, CNT family